MDTSDLYVALSRMGYGPATEAVLAVVARAYEYIESEDGATSVALDLGLTDVAVPDALRYLRIHEDGRVETISRAEAYGMI